MTKLLSAYSAFEEDGRYITSATMASVDDPFIRKLIDGAASSVEEDRAYRFITFHDHLPEKIKTMAEEKLSRKVVLQEDAYVVYVEPEGVSVYAENERGWVYGISELLNNAPDGLIRYGIMYNSPLCPVRGMKLYLPPSDGIAYFKSFVDLMCRYHYNTIVIEVGGAMEYKRHPEINEGWVRRCEELTEYSGKTIEVQEKTYLWYKNSIHVENGGGHYLSQEQVADLVSYCKERMLDVIPEVPSLSHCDYLMINHPELSERSEDPYPDTYCPSDERSYQLLFDVLDEVLEVFEPKAVQIGHDEYYTVGLCDKCKGKSAETLFADDINRIYDFLKQRGVGTIMWGDKLINAINKSGVPKGGAERPMTNHYTGVYMGETIPATYGAIDLIPGDIGIMHWYWSMDETFEDVFLSRNMNMVYGNFFGQTFVDWHRHLEKGARGAIISNWSVTSQDHMQRNRVLFALAYSAYMFWNEDYTDSRYEEIAELAFDDLYHQHYGKWANSDRKSNKGTTFVEITHTTDCKKPYVVFYDGVLLDNEAYKIGDHLLEYEDGTVHQAPIIYGLNISNEDVQWERNRVSDGHGLSDQYQSDSLLEETAFTTRPIRIEGKTYYRYMIVNPYPNKTIIQVRTKASHSESCRIHVKEINIVG